MLFDDFHQHTKRHGFFKNKKLESKTISHLKMDGFHWAALANITEEHPVSSRYFSMSSNVLTSEETPFAITGIETASATLRITSMWTGSRDRSCFSLLVTKWRQNKCKNQEVPQGSFLEPSTITYINHSLTWPRINDLLHCKVPQGYHRATTWVMRDLEKMMALMRCK